MATYIDKGQRVQLVPTDPWDLVTVTSSGPFPGVVTDVDSSDYETIVIHLADVFGYMGIEARFIVAFTRHVGKKFGPAGQGTALCNIASLTEHEASAAIFRPNLSLGSRMRFIGDISW